MKVQKQYTFLCLLKITAIFLFFPLALISCSLDLPEEQYRINSELDAILRRLPANTVDNPHTVTMKVNSIKGLAGALKANPNKYVNLDLSGSTITSISNKYNVGNVLYTDFDDTFEECLTLIGITIPNSVTIIGNLAFYECRNLASIIIPNSVSAIGSMAFRFCESLTEITIPDSVTRIGDNAFGGCINLKSVTLGSRLTSIREFTFTDCESLESIIIPDSITSIGLAAFQRCTSLKSVTIGNGVTSIGDSAFLACFILTDITIPDNVTSIGRSAFSGCGFTGITIPSRVTSIGSGAFSSRYMMFISVDGANPMYSSSDGILYNKDKTTLLQYPGGKTDTVNIPSIVTSIGEGAFANSIKLTDITIPNSVTSIGNGAFANCTNLTSVTILDGVINIGDYAFTYCISLNDINIPNSVTSIGEKTFSRCTSLMSISVSEDNSVFSSANGVLYSKNKTILLLYPEGKTDDIFIVPNSVIRIYKEAFMNINLTGVTIPSSVTGIGFQAFSWCGNLVSVTFEGESISPVVDNNFNDFNRFPPFRGDLWDKYLDGSAGTYTRIPPSYVWTKQ